jgi:RNA polymerase sigma factor (sigma-70 family)
MIAMEKTKTVHYMSNDEQEFKKIYHPFKGLIERRALFLTGSRSGIDDIAQDILLKVWTNWKQLKEFSAAGLEHYVYVMVRNHISNMRKKQSMIRRHWHTYFEVLPDCYLHDEIVVAEGLMIYHKAIAQLPARQKQVYLYRVDEYNTGEIAEVMSVSKHTVKNQLTQAYKTVRSYLGKGLDIKIEEDGRRKLWKMVA